MIVRCVGNYEKKRGIYSVGMRGWMEEEFLESKRYLLTKELGSF